MRLEDIRVIEAPLAAPSEAALNAPALLHEIATRLARLVEAGEVASIDLKSLPLAPADYDYLAQVLGEGEVVIEIDAAGKSRVRETAVHGVWWVTHLDDNDAVGTEFIEICCVPEIVKTHPSDVAAGLAVLRGRLARTLSVPEGDRHGE